MRKTGFRGTFALTSLPRMKMIHPLVFYSNPATPRSILEFKEPHDESMSINDYVALFTTRVKRQNVADRVEVMRMWIDGELIYLSAGPA